MDVSTADAGDGVLLVRVAGEIDLAVVGGLESAITGAVTADGVVRVVVDLGGVTFCDSSGIAAFDRAYFAAGRRGVGFELIAVQPAVRRVLELTGVWDSLTRP